MDNIKNGEKAKWSKSFWPLAIIVIVSMIAGGVIYSFAYQSMLNDDISSMQFLIHRDRQEKPTTTPAAKSDVMTAKKPAK
ncbi:MAG: hypothetical protein HY918_05290 [Candidatus Doudnabacteria bacterium]|nr:hypothetical protein [Candidatus Doudnabacteria bacterium]